ncbi:hypothetical protein LX97_01632 [Nonlabens dokdonensis]|jgi:hypothetical protein|nr:hypothetical protein [Nonlabens dokdonensis]PZX40859.1 hypothetical protein LX97_01632 [Nonlabens dokdonensis]
MKQLQVIYKISILFVLFSMFLFIGCSKEDDQREYNLIFSNESNVPVTLEFYGVNASISVLLDSFVVASNSSFNCDYVAEGFMSLLGCPEIDGIERGNKIIIKFEDNLGYDCIVIGDNTKCFSGDRNLFAGSTIAWQQDGNNYTFTITQQDFDNAFDLP